MLSLVPSTELMQLIDEVDKNGDGEIDFEEFQAMMAKV
jgi:Ca2+-binding EF-hand superfamily protein